MKHPDLVRIIRLSLLVICLMPAAFRGQDALNAVPILRLDKTRFISGEHVSFWIGVKQLTPSPISKEHQGSCKMTITRPDGTQKVQNVGWRMDGTPDRGWVGGWGLGDEPIQIGRYTLVFEFAGQKTSPEHLYIEDNPVLSRIKAEFLFGQAGSQSIIETKEPTKEKVTLVVRNDSDQVVRFPDFSEGWRFLLTQTVSVRIESTGKYSNSFFYPDDELMKSRQKAGTSIFDQFGWDASGKVSTIKLKPGETYRKEFSLQAALDQAKQTSPFAPDIYNITFSTRISMLIGEKDGPWAARSPFGMVARNSAIYSIQE